MSAYGSLLAVLTALAAGLVAATVFATAARSRRTVFYRLFLTQLLLFNLLTLIGLVWLFARFELERGGAFGQSSLLPVVLGLMAAIKTAWLVAFVAMTRALRERELPRVFRRRAVVGGVLLFVATSSVTALGVLLDRSWLVEFALAAFELAVLLGAIAAGATLALRARRLPAGPRRRNIRALGTVWTCLIGLALISLLLGWFRPTGQTWSLLTTNGLLLTLFNLVPLVWVVKVDPPSAGWSPERFGLTEREREIVELIAGGLRNREIADRLFISLATVKDHNSRIFTKTGVRNRTELALLVRSVGKP
jgi:DNA-binding CsgD family transcriptional regulator